MARSKNGINGIVSGKIGKLVYTSWNGIQVIKQAPVRTAPPTPAEAAKRYIFDFTQKWLGPLSDVLRAGFKEYTPTVKGIPAAKSFLYANALHKDGENSSIDPAKMQVSYGELPLPADLAAVKLSDFEIEFTWDPSHLKNTSPHDQVMLVAYDIEGKKAAYTLNGQFRKTGRDVLEVKGFSGTLHLYAAFLAADRSRQSHSVYLGTV